MNSEGLDHGMLPRVPMFELQRSLSRTQTATEPSNWTISHLGPVQSRELPKQLDRVLLLQPNHLRVLSFQTHTLYPIDLDLGALMYRFEGLTPSSRHRTFLLHAIEDGASHPPHGAPPPLGC
jgi:hypothetical protein